MAIAEKCKYMSGLKIAEVVPNMPRRWTGDEQKGCKKSK